MSEHAKHPTTGAYISVFAALAVLTGVTVGISFTGLGPEMRSFLAFTIASVKTLLVVSIFMHLRFEPKTIVIFAVTPVLLAILFILAIGPDVSAVSN